MKRLRFLWLLLIPGIAWAVGEGLSTWLAMTDSGVLADGDLFGITNISRKTGDGASTDGTSEKITWAQLQTNIETGVLTGGSANWSTTGTITGKLETATDADAHTLLSAEYHGGTVLATGAGIYTLPTAADGYSGCVEAGQGVTAVIKLLPGTGDYIVHEGVRLTIATSIESGGAAGDRICYRSYNADDWYVSTFGTWVVTP